MHLMDGHLPWRSTFFHSSPDSPPPPQKKIATYNRAIILITQNCI